MGSRVHDLVGDDMMARRTSSSDQTSSSVSDELTAGCDGSDEGGQLAVLALTDSTFFSKHSMKSSAVCFDNPVSFFVSSLITSQNLGQQLPELR